MLILIRKVSRQVLAFAAQGLVGEVCVHSFHVPKLWPSFHVVFGWCWFDELCRFWMWTLGFQGWNSMSLRSSMIQPSPHQSDFWMKKSLFVENLRFPLLSVLWCILTSTFSKGKFKNQTKKYHWSLIPRTAWVSIEAHSGI